MAIFNANNVDVYDSGTKYLPVWTVGVVVASVVAASFFLPIDPPRPDNVVYVETAKYSSHYEIPSDSLFDFDSPILRDDAIQLISSIATKLKKTGEHTSILVIGHADSIGSAEYNLQLSKKRAIAVRDKIIEVAGFKKEDVQAIGIGADNPITGAEQCTRESNPEKRKDCEKPNRRVEIWYRPQTNQNPP
ncbi:OmpA family protein [Paraburkholderia sp. UYCP14C]|uniref:OmpA family protein n=1 Tax=Paraburkholderia sp. UYCP14C TaxID=2511130 RepID=UPI0010206F3C|nr:OmpA family protein [Paraburkholderia sp. UYCP14C]RZF30004.1 OmpA family protein [Paraburkholderia sp. UYCP14C]